MPEKFIVPQFIDKEDQISTHHRPAIFDPARHDLLYFHFLCLRSYFVGSALLLAIFSGTFAFMKINGQPFHVFS